MSEGGTGSFRAGQGDVLLDGTTKRRLQKIRQMSIDSGAHGTTDKDRWINEAANFL